MGLLDHLWDDTVAGPRPESGLGKLRKHNTFSFRSGAGKEISESGNMRSFGDDSTEEATRVTRSIMIVKPPPPPLPQQGSQNESPPISPAGSTPPVSPFAGSSLTGGRESFRFRRRLSSSDAYEKATGLGTMSPRPPYEM